MRDVQKSKVYAADDETKQKHAVWFNTLEKAQAFTNRVTGHPEWTGPTQIPIELTRRDSWKSYCHYRGSKIRLSPADGINDIILLHELAHVITPWTGVQDHGPEFCANYLMLVERHVGPLTARTLRETFEENGVKYQKGAA